MPIDIKITDTQIRITAENGDVVVLDRQTGQPTQTRRGIKSTPRARADITPKLTEVKVSPRWIARVGDTVLAQHKPGGRKFRTTIRAFKAENGTTYAQVADPRNGGTYLLALDRLTRTRS